MNNSAILERLGISELYEMQNERLQLAHSDNDIVLLSPTGSGKTLGFLLPLLYNLNNKAVTQALILVPSRELALQVSDVFSRMRRDFRSYCCYGGHSILEEKRSLAGNPIHVVIGTPGRIGDHLRNGNFSAQNIKTLIIDEFDKSLEFGFQDEMSEILSLLPALKKRVLTSATDAEEIPLFAGMENTVKLNFLPENADQSRLTLKKVVSPARDKIETLYNLLCQFGTDSSIVFCNHRDAVDRVASLLAEKGVYSARFHGGMEQDDRERALYKYRNGSAYILVSTDLAARGLDISHVKHIVHYHLPVKEDAFVHRNGRTARWDAVGQAYVILCDDETQPDYITEQLEIHEVSSTAKKPQAPKWMTLYIGRGKKEKLSKMDVAGFLYKKGGLSKDDLGNIDIREHYGLATVRRDKVKNLLKIIKGEKLKGKKILIEEAR